jgi:hypothetical protein
MATEWLEADHDTVLRLAYMVDAVACGEGGAVLLREIRHLEEAFGLSPMARRRLGWEIGPERGADVHPHPASARRIQAIDPNPDTKKGTP